MSLKAILALLVLCIMAAPSFSLVGNNQIIDNAGSMPGGIVNPANSYCKDNGGNPVLIKEDGKAVGYCVFEDGTECEEWAFYRKECKKGEHRREENYKYILFAHGMGADKSDWDYFALIAESKGYKVFRTNVDKCGSVEKRAEELAKYIISLQLPDNSLVAVGHSMGGIDLRYIIGEAHAKHEPFYSAGKKIKKIYTLASPNGGSVGLSKLVAYQGCALYNDGKCVIEINSADIKGLNRVVTCTDDTDAWKSLTDISMEKFNKKYPYSKFSVDGRKVGFYAYHFQCKVCGGASDCVVGANGQTWKGAPYRPGPSIESVHSKDVYENLCRNIKEACNGLCNAQCSSCDCRTVDVGPVHQTICPPLRDQCLSLCNRCRSNCDSCPACIYEQGNREVIDEILEYAGSGQESKKLEAKATMKTKPLEEKTVGSEKMEREKETLGSEKEVDENNKSKETQDNEYRENKKDNKKSYENKTEKRNQKENKDKNENANQEEPKDANKEKHKGDYENTEALGINKTIKNGKENYRLYVNTTKNSFKLKIKLNLRKSTIAKFMLSDKEVVADNKIIDYRQISNKTEIPAEIELNYNGKSYNAEAIIGKNPRILFNLTNNGDGKSLGYDSLPISSDFGIENNSLVLYDGDSEYKVDVSPIRVFNKLNEIGEDNKAMLSNISLGMRNGNPTYMVKLKEKAKIAWIIPITTENSYSIDAETGDVKANNFPWYITDTSMQNIASFI